MTRILSHKLCGMALGLTEQEELPLTLLLTIMRAPSLSQPQDCTTASFPAQWMMLELEPFQQHFSWPFTVSVHSQHFLMIITFINVNWSNSYTNSAAIWIPLQLFPAHLNACYLSVNLFNIVLHRSSHWRCTTIDSSLSEQWFLHHHLLH